MSLRGTPAHLVVLALWLVSCGGLAAGGEGGSHPQDGATTACASEGPGNLVANGGFDVGNWEEVSNTKWESEDALGCSSSGSSRIGVDGYTRSPCFPIIPSADYTFGFTTRSVQGGGVSCAVYWFTESGCTAVGTRTPRTDFLSNTAGGSDWISFTLNAATPDDASWANAFCVRNGSTPGGDLDLVFFKAGTDKRWLP